MQLKRHSFMEAVLNVSSGMFIAFGLSQLAAAYEAEIQQYIWKDFIWKLSTGSNLIMTAVFTGVSIVRGYVWRRIFNRIQIANYSRINLVNEEKLNGPTKERI